MYDHNLKKEIIILHDTDGRPYYKALEMSNKYNVIYYESSVFRLFLRELYKFKKANVKKLLRNFIFRCKVPWMKNKIIIFGMAPYDFRISYYALLCNKNHVIEHTSWPYWGQRYVPRTYGILTNLSKKVWRKVLSSDNINIVCVSESAFKTINLFRNVNEHSTVIPHVIDTPVLENVPARKEKTLIFIGKLIPEKGIDKIISFAEEHPDYMVTIIGDGPLKNKVLQASMKFSNLEYLGFIKNRQQIYHHLLESTFFYLPSIRTKRWEELFGISIIEAMSCGCICFCSDHVGPRQIINDKINGFVLDENHTSQDIIDIINNSDLEKISKNAIMEVQKYNLETVQGLWDNLIESVISERGIK
ncbi:glycosyltransferase [Klebsiella pasteurii]|uniref:glycosyltransferase n=1 Tax=Klebsiella pasteurii TaxID=2587529 RepID=UPI0018C6EBC5|nr:glycosyltransferase [Klebsiella michiganensis]